MKVILIFLFGFVLGAVSHEMDMARNFAKNGDAKAWVTDIKCRKD